CPPSSLPPPSPYTTLFRSFDRLFIKHRYSVRKYFLSRPFFCLYEQYRPPDVKPSEILFCDDFPVHHFYDRCIADITVDIQFIHFRSGVIEVEGGIDMGADMGARLNLTDIDGAALPFRHRRRITEWCIFRPVCNGVFKCLRNINPHQATTPRLLSNSSYRRSSIISLRTTTALYSSSNELYNATGAILT